MIRIALCMFSALYPMLVFAVQGEVSDRNHSVKYEVKYKVNEVLFRPKTSTAELENIKIESIEKDQAPKDPGTP